MGYALEALIMDLYIQLVFITVAQLERYQVLFIWRNIETGKHLYYLAGFLISPANQFRLQINGSLSRFFGIS